MKKLRDFFQSLYFKTEGISIVGFIILLLGSISWRLLFNQPIPEKYLYTLLVIALLFLALGSFNVIKYKEMPRVGFPNTTGFWAIFFGALCLIFSIVSIIIILSKILQT